MRKKRDLSTFLGRLEKTGKRGVIKEDGPYQRSKKSEIAAFSQQSREKENKRVFCWRKIKLLFYYRIVIL